jgi:hypothetical protein
MVEASRTSSSPPPVGSKSALSHEAAYAAHVSTHRDHVPGRAKHALHEIEFRANSLAFLPPPPAPTA